MEQPKSRIIYTPQIFEGDQRVLSDAHKNRIRKILSSEEFRIILSLANESRPPSNPHDGSTDGQAKQLCRIQGWELHEVLMINCLNIVNQQKPEQLEETFPTIEKI